MGRGGEREGSGAERCGEVGVNFVGLVADVNVLWWPIFCNTWLLKPYFHCRRRVNASPWFSSILSNLSPSSMRLQGHKKQQRVEEEGGLVVVKEEVRRYQSRGIHLSRARGSACKGLYR